MSKEGIKEIVKILTMIAHAEVGVGRKIIVHERPRVGEEIMVVVVVVGGGESKFNA
jgi:hypothetical protein